MTRVVSVSLLVFFVTAAVVAQTASTAPPTADLLQVLPTLCDFQMRRITSADPTGGNATGGHRAGRDAGAGRHPGARAASSTSATTSPATSRITCSFTSCGCIGTAKSDAERRGARGRFLRRRLRLHRADQLRADVHRPAAAARLTDPAASGAARNCYFPMPFARSARITLTNEGKQPSQHWVRDQLPHVSRSRRRTSSISTPNTARARRRRRAPT